MSISKTYHPVDIENKWYAYWLENNMFRSVSDPDQWGKRKEPYTIVIPPPNVTGVLHMGHMLNNTIQDVLVRRARMLGKNACWVPGTDHASIATEAKVVNMLREEGLSKEQLGREAFLNRAFEWKEKYGDIILEQLKKLGASCDWDRTRFTMEESMNRSVQQVFIKLYDKGLIYRGVRMVNWDPVGRTAVSDEEVIHKSVNQRLYYIAYPFTDGGGELIIATARPETIMADAAICVNPKDIRYKKFIGKKVKIPLIGVEIPIIEDDYVDIDFGTGCLKVTPAHSLQDYEIGMRHKLPVVDILNDDGTLNGKARIYVGEDRFIARKKIAKELHELGFLKKTEDYQSQVGFSERTDAVIEPRLSLQWFLDMKTLSKPALDVVENGQIKLFPARFMNTYRHWMENVHDWCISRQLWWGQRIPAWYNENGDFVVAMNLDEAASKFKENLLSIQGIRQDDDVVDTWFSSWLWPISVFDGIEHPENPDILYYFPTNDLVTGPDILFFWVARMIMAGKEFMHEIPFRNVYLTGLIRDKQGRKMSKSLGNSPDPLELIEKFGADAVRTGLLLSSPAGNDLLYDQALIEQGRNFANKIWNAFRLVKSWEEGINEVKKLKVAQEKLSQPLHSQVAINAFSVSLNKVLEEVELLFKQYRLSEALMAIYKLVWDDFCSWYLELIKPEVDTFPDEITFNNTLNFFEQLLSLLHPFMPFITEELWHEIKDRNSGESIMLGAWPRSVSLHENELADHDFYEKYLKPLVQAIRNSRNAYAIPMRSPLKLGMSESSLSVTEAQTASIMKAANISSFSVMNVKPEASVSLLVSGAEFYLETGVVIDKETELKKMEDDLHYTKGFLVSVEAKLLNERFVKNAKPEIVEIERQKRNDAQEKILRLNQAIISLNNP